MRSGTSCFNFTVWKKTFLRFWPIWAANLVFWLLLMPLQGLMAMRRQEPMASFSQNVGNSTYEFIVFALVFGLMAAMAAFSHLWSARSANFSGALPVRREGLFMSHYLAGLAMLLLPNLAVFLLTLLVEAAGGALMMTPLLFWLGCLCGSEFFFYSFAVCLGLFTGHILALPVFYGIFNCIFAALYMVVQWVFERFYYGWAPSGDGLVYELVVWLTPVWKLLGGAVFCYPDDAGFTIVGGPVLGIYALAGAALAVCALLLYRRRHLETAGDVVAVKAMRPVFKYGVAVCAGLFLGFLTQMLLSLGEAGLMTSILLWGAAGCFIAQMLLDKTFRVFRKWKGAAAVAGVFVLLFLVVGFDLTGYETRVPGADQVSYVEVSGLQGSPSDGGSYWSYLKVEDPALIETVTALHRQAAAQRDQSADYGDFYWFSFALSYHLADGSTMTRSYDLWGSEGDEKVEGSAAQLVQALLDDREMTRKAYGFDQAETVLAEGGRLASVCFRPVEEEYRRPDGEVVTALAEETYFYGGDAQDLWDAVRADFDAGDIGRHAIRGLSEYEEQLPTLTLEFQTPMRGYTDEHGAAVDYVESSVRINIAVADTAQRTRAVLAQLLK